MPSSRENGDSVEVKLYDVVATDAEDIPRFLRHAGLASAEGSQERKKVNVSDMSPPLHPGEFEVQADAVGRAELEEPERRKIKVFIDRHTGEHASIAQLGLTNFAKAYCVLPHAAPLEEADGRYARTRFSCAGFVFEAYKTAGIRLVDETQLPPITLEHIKQAYSNCARALDIERFREALGLIGSGPWPVMLCGYLINSLSRDKHAIRQSPHLVQQGDELFPREEPEQN